MLRNQPLLSRRDSLPLISYAIRKWRKNVLVPKWYRVTHLIQVWFMQTGGERLLSDIRKGETAYSPVLPRSFLSSSMSSSARSSIWLPGSRRAVINRPNAFGPLFSNKLNILCVPWVAPWVFSLALISSISELLKIGLRYAENTVGLVILFMILVVLLANTLLWTGSIVATVSAKTAKMTQLVSIRPQPTQSRKL